MVRKHKNRLISLIYRIILTSLLFNVYLLYNIIIIIGNRNTHAVVSKRKTTKFETSNNLCLLIFNIIYNNDNNKLNKEKTRKHFFDQSYINVKTQTLDSIVLFGGYYC